MGFTQTQRQNVYVNVTRNDQENNTRLKKNWRSTNTTCRQWPLVAPSKKSLFFHHQLTMLKELHTKIHVAAVLFAVREKGRCINIVLTSRNGGHKLRHPGAVAVFTVKGQKVCQSESWLLCQRQQKEKEKVRSLVLDFRKFYHKLGQKQQIHYLDNQIKQWNKMKTNLIFAIFWNERHLLLNLPYKANTWSKLRSPFQNKTPFFHQDHSLSSSPKPEPEQPGVVAGLWPPLHSRVTFC